MANYQPCGAVLNIVSSSSKAATLLAWLTKPMIQYHLQKLNQAGKATHSLVPLPVTMTLNYSQSLAGHTSSIFTPDNKSKFKHLTQEMQERLTHPKGNAPCWICCWKGWYALLIWCRNHGMNTLPILLPTKKLLLNEVGVQWTTASSSIRKFNWKTPNLQTEANNNQSVVSVLPSGLNLSHGITGTLVDQVSIVSQSCCNKRYTAGLHVAVGRYLNFWSGRWRVEKEAACGRSAVWARV